MAKSKTTKIDGMDPSTYPDVQGGKVIDVSAEVVEGNVVDGPASDKLDEILKDRQLTEEEKKLHDLQFLIASKGTSAPVKKKKKSAKQRKEEASLNLADHANKLKANRKLNNLNLSLKNNYDQMQKLKKQRVVLERQLKETLKAYKLLFGE